jgi:hypothetical protein
VNGFIASFTVFNMRTKGSGTCSALLGNQSFRLGRIASALLTVTS